MKTLLVLPIREGNNYQVTPDCGLLYLGTALQKKGHNVTILDCPKEGFSFGQFRDFVREGSFEVVGFRCFSRDHNYVRHHLKIVKDLNPETLTLAGGPHPSALPEFVLSAMPQLDFAWQSEAEEGMPLLLELIAGKRSGLTAQELCSIPGLVWRDRNEERIRVNPTIFGQNLDDYGIPAWELIHPDTYPGFIWDQYYPILTTRGCPYPCTYCNTPGLSGKKLRHRSVESVVEELFFLKKRYGIERFSIIDDEFTLSRKYAKSVCEGLIDAGLNLKWDCPVGVRLDSLTPDLLQVMEEAGCESLAVGIESGNDRVQGMIQKRVTVDKIREKANMIAGCSKIRITGYFMIGFLDEKPEEIRDTIRLACELPLVRANFNVVIPIPGTAIFRELLDEGLLDLDRVNWDTLTSDQVAFQRRHVAGSQLMKLQRSAYLHFYSRPKIVADLVKEAMQNREVIRASLRNLKALLHKNQTYTFTPMYLREEIPGG